MLPACHVTFLYLKKQTNEQTSTKNAKVVNKNHHIVEGDFRSLSPMELNKMKGY